MSEYSPKIIKKLDGTYTSVRFVPEYGCLPNTVQWEAKPCNIVMSKEHMYGDGSMLKYFSHAVTCEFTVPDPYRVNTGKVECVSTHINSCDIYAESSDGKILKIMIPFERADEQNEILNKLNGINPDGDVTGPFILYYKTSNFGEEYEENLANPSNNVKIIVKDKPNPEDDNNPYSDIDIICSDLDEVRDILDTLHIILDNSSPIPCPILFSWRKTEGGECEYIVSIGNCTNQQKYVILDRIA